MLPERNAVAYDRDRAGGNDRLPECSSGFLSMGELAMEEFRPSFPVTRHPLRIAPVASDAGRPVLPAAAATTKDHGLP